MIQTLFAFSYLLMLVIGLILPSDGNHGLLAPKSLSFLFCGGTTILFFIMQTKFSKSEFRALYALGIFLFFLTGWYLVGLSQDPLRPSREFDQFKLFLITYFVPFSAWFLIKQKILTIQTLLKVTLYANFSYCLAKVILMALHLFKILNVWTFMHATGLRFMSMHIFGDIGRIQTSVDIVTPFLIYFALQANRLGLSLSKKFKISYFIVTLLSNFLSFSRFLIAVYMISCLLYLITLSFQRIIKLSFFSLGILIAIVTYIGPAAVESIIEKRFFSADNTNSDLVRQQQIDALLNSFEKSPLFGQGMGGYSPECIRDCVLLHPYEVQWVSFLMQFGLIGLIFLTIPLIIVFSIFLNSSWTMTKGGFLSLFSLWILSGFTNPFLISLTSGIIYMLFLIVAEELRLQSLKLQVK